VVQAYNFLGSWQLFPEKGSYDLGERPKSGIYKIETTTEKKELVISHNWIALDNRGFHSQYRVMADGALHDFEDKALAEEIQVVFAGSLDFDMHFYRGGRVFLHIIHELLPNGYMKITQQGFQPDGNAYTNTETYHRQMSVMPYAASVSGALVKPTEEGVIRHKALTAMEEQTNMQLDQIRKQVELLALQAQEIHKRKELSMMIYQAKLSFKPEIGQVYYLYEKSDGSHMISLISPKEWNMPFKKFVAAVQLLADHTWKEL
jgi:hypothetical protein